MMIIHGRDLFFDGFYIFSLVLNSVLNTISQIGAFLIRPQLNKTSPNDHDYVCNQ